MNVYVFSSKNLTNIWAGIGAGMWATSQASAQDRAARLTRSRSMLPGSFGLLYCTSNHSLTAPFIVVSQAEDRAISDIWPERWDLPFRIRALGDPRRCLPKDEAKKVLPCFQGLGSFHRCFRSRWRLCVRPLNHPAEGLGDFVHTSR
jgi:hypothetical protein